MKGKITHASLFSGIGACDLAAEWMGWSNQFWCEIDNFCQQVLKYHFPESIGYGNIKETDFKKWRGRIDVLTGGFPCQPFSCAGRRKGAGDDRYLWPEMLRAIREIQPSWVVGENVGGIVSMVQPGRETKLGGQGSLFGEDNSIYERRQQYVVETICQDLEREGYSVQPVLVPACALGAPHRRDRVFFIAHLEDPVCHGYEGEPCERKDAPEARRQRVSDTGDTERMGSEERAAANAYCYGGPEKTECEYKEDKENDEQSKSVFNTRTSANRDDPGLESQRQGRKNKIYGLESSADSCIQRLSAECIKGCDGQEERYTSHGRSIESPHHDRSTPFSDRWRDFPTQPPVCRGNDGLPFDVDNLTISFSRWRTESIKAYGNAIVPQVVYEIFKAIEKEF